MPSHFLTFALLSAALLTACASSVGATDDVAQRALPPEASPSAQPIIPEPPVLQPQAPTLVLRGSPVFPQAGEEESIRLAIQALSEATGVLPDQLQLDLVEAIQWRDSSLGCPKKGELYAKLMIPGHKVRLILNGESFAVHVGDGRAVVCDPRFGRELPFIDLNAVKRLGELAAIDLATRLRVPEGEIRILGIQPRDWPNANLGCPQPGMTYEQTIIPGLLIELEHRDRSYEYHSDMDSTVIPCDQG